MPHHRVKDVLGEAVAMTDQLAREHGTDGAILHMLGVLALQNERILRALQFGKGTYSIRPVNLGTTATEIVDKHLDGKDGPVRKVQVWVDSAVGGPAPTIRVGEGISGAAGGIRLIAGQMNDLGEIPPDVRLLAASSAAITAYVVEHS